MREMLPLPLKFMAFGLSSNDSALFAKLLASTDAMHEEIESVVAILREKAPSHGSQRNWEIKDGGAASYSSLQMVETEEVPFERSDVNAAMRGLFRKSDSNPYGDEVRHNRPCVHWPLTCPLACRH